MSAKKDQHIKAMAELLDKMLHDGPWGRAHNPTSDCWPDCLACAWEKLKEGHKIKTSGDS